MFICSGSIGVISIFSLIITIVATPSQVPLKSHSSVQKSKCLVDRLCTWVDSIQNVLRTVWTVGIYILSKLLWLIVDADPIFTVSSSRGYCFLLSTTTLTHVLLLSQNSSIIPKKFSSCSLQDFEKYMLNDMPKCLTNIPDINAIIAPSSCGNGFVEKGEECDCGTSEVSTQLGIK